MPAKSYWIKERHNGQTEPYFVAQGQLGKKEAKARTNSLAGHNLMHEYKSKEAYEAQLQKLKVQKLLV